MRCFTTIWCDLQSNPGRAGNRSTIKSVASLLAVAAVVALTPAYGKDRFEKEAKSSAKGTQTHAQAEQESPAIPEFLMKLKLSAEQQDQIKEIVHNYDESLGAVWQQFGQRYMQTICMETSLLAAIEDNLTEEQRQQVRDQRRKMAKHERAMAATNAKPNQAEVTKDEETTKPANAAEEGLAVIDVSLTDEQEAVADKIQEKYRTQLRSLNRDIQGLHTRLVSLEADKLVEIEKVLTKEQLSQLRKHRQTAPEAPKVAVSRSEPTTSKTK